MDFARPVVKVVDMNIIVSFMLLTNKCMNNDNSYDFSEHVEMQVE